jgi:hypothetical protein
VKGDHHHPHQYATETFCALVFAVCVLLALLLLTGCTPKAEPPPELKPVVQASSVKFPGDSPAMQRIAVERPGL